MLSISTANTKEYNDEITIPTIASQSVVRRWSFKSGNTLTNVVPTSKGDGKIYFGMLPTLLIICHNISSKIKENMKYFYQLFALSYWHFVKVHLPIARFSLASLSLLPSVFCNFLIYGHTFRFKINLNDERSFFPLLLLPYILGFFTISNNSSSSPFHGGFHRTDFIFNIAGSYISITLSTIWYVFSLFTLYNL